MLAQWHDVFLAFPDKTVLDGVSFTIHRGDKIGLVGENGSGKTSLLRLLLGELQPDRGRIVRAAGLRIGYLKQTLLDTEPGERERPCIEAAMDPFAHLVALEQEIEALSAQLGDPNKAPHVERLLDALGAKQEQFEQLGGYTFRHRVEATLRGLGLPRDHWYTPVSRLSAGQKVRLALARLILDEYDLLLLDEPTNHLDVEARRWLEAALRAMPIAAIVVSHDRQFLDGVVNKIAHLDRGRLTEYPGNYSAFRQQREQQLAAAWNTYENRQKQVRKLQEQVRNYANWSAAKERQKRGVYDKGYVGHKAAKLMKRSLAARRRLEQTIEKMRLEKPFEKDPVVIDFHPGEGRRHLVAARDLAIGFHRERPLASGISFDVEMGERLAVQGPNGVGKTTLLRTVLGHIPPLEGFLHLSRSARVGYFDQENRQLPPDLSALEAVLESGQDETLVRTVMGRMGIQQGSVHKKVAELSAGERAKVLLTRLILGRYNLLVLDEPTNYLDIETQDTLLEALADFPGGILFVSHDRHFNETLATGVLELVPPMESAESWPPGRHRAERPHPGG